MGQACEDADGNGLLDLFVRNGDLESTTLYLREAPRGVSDSMACCQLRGPRIPTLATKILDSLRR